MYRRYDPLVFRFSLSMTGCTAAAEDVAQDVFIELFRHQARFDRARAALASYLYGIARNVARQRRRREGWPLSLSDIDAGAMAAFDADPLPELEGRERAATVRRVVNGLPASCREPLLLCDLHDLRYADAAALLGTSVATLRHRLRKARSLVRTRLDKTLRTISRVRGNHMHGLACHCVRVLCVIAACCCAVPAALNTSADEELEPRVVAAAGVTTLGLSGFIDKVSSSEDAFPWNATAQFDLTRFLTRRLAARIGLVGSTTADGLDDDERIGAAAPAFYATAAALVYLTPSAVISPYLGIEYRARLTERPGEGCRHRARPRRSPGVDLVQDQRLCRGRLWHRPHARQRGRAANALCHLVWRAGPLLMSVLAITLLGFAAAAAQAQTPPQTVCGLPVPAPATAPTPGGSPAIVALLLCFDKQGGSSSIDPATYLYYVHLRPSEASLGVWRTFDDDAERTARDDFGRLWATGFLDDLVIETVPYPFANGAEGVVVVYRMHERQRVKLVDYEGLDSVGRSAVLDALKEKGITLRLDAFLDPLQMRRAATVIRELMARQGLPLRGGDAERGSPCPTNRNSPAFDSSSRRDRRWPYGPCSSWATPRLLMSDCAAC